MNDIELGTQQKQQVREGKPVELNVGGEKVSVGIDLKEPQGFRIVNGDMKEWERQQKLRYDEQHPEFIGLVMTDKTAGSIRRSLTGSQPNAPSDLTRQEMSSVALEA